MIKKIIDWIKYHPKAESVIKNCPDKRDYKHKSVGSIELAKSVDLRKHFNEIRAQSISNACVGFNCTAALVEFLINKYHSKKHKMTVSPLFNWYYARLMRGWQDKNTGVYPRDAIKSLYKNGFVQEQFMPFKNNLLRKPDDIAYITGLTNKIFLDRTTYHFLKPEQVKEVLNQGYPVAFHMLLNDSFYGNRTGNIDENSKESVGRHEMTVVGYKNDCFIVRNSWGKNWGDKGYCYIPCKLFIAKAEDCMYIKI